MSEATMGKTRKNMVNGNSEGQSIKSNVVVDEHSPTSLEHEIKAKLKVSDCEDEENGKSLLNCNGINSSENASRTKDSADVIQDDINHDQNERITSSETEESAELSNQNEGNEHANVAEDVVDGVKYVIYQSELQMPDIMRLIQKDLSEPYSIYTYRYFIHNWPDLCFMAHVDGECVGAIVCKLDYHKKVIKRGYIAMLAVDSKHRKRKIGSTLVRKAIERMKEQEADEVVLETEITNKSALRLYENLGFVRDKRLFRYYLNGVDALRLKLWFR